MASHLRRIRIAVMATLVAFVHEARALDLDWRAPAACPTAEAVMREVRRLAGTSESAAIVARAVVDQGPDQRWRVTLELSGAATGHRTLTADNCAQLARASALIIALAANPEAALDLTAEERLSTEPPRLLPPLPLAPPSGVPSADGKRESEEEPAGVEQREPRANPDFVQDDTTGHKVHRRVHVPIELLVRSGIQNGSLPTPTLWLGLGARAKVVPYPFHFALTAHATQSTSATFTNGVGADFRAAALQSRLCLEPLSSPLVVALCAGMQVSWIRVSGYAPADLSEAGYARATTYVVNRFIPGPFGSAYLGYELLSRWTVDLGLDVVSPTKRWRFAVEDLGELHRADLVEFVAYLGLGIRLN